MKNIELLIKIESATARMNLSYQILGHFGDKIQEDVKKYLEDEIKDEKSLIKKLSHRIVL